MPVLNLIKRGYDMASELNIGVMQNLYEFGGLLSYRISYFDPAMFQIIEMQPTFSEEVAKINLKRLKENGVEARLVEQLIKFDGAFAVKS